MTYTAYFALFPLWPRDVDVPRFRGLSLVPNTPMVIDKDARELFNPRALLMLFLVVRRLV